MWLWPPWPRDRDRRSQRWFLVKGEAHAVFADASNCDIAMHNHVPVAFGMQRMDRPLPSIGDLVASAGRPTRCFVISVDGLFEWSPHLHFPGHPERTLREDSPAAEFTAFGNTLYRGPLNRLGLARLQLWRCGAKLKKHGWSSATYTLAADQPGGFLATADREPGCWGWLKSQGCSSRQAQQTP